MAASVFMTVRHGQDYNRKSSFMRPSYVVNKSVMLVFVYEWSKL